DQKDFPVQGRYGKGVVAWDMPGKSTLAAVASGKPNHVATVHMSKGAPKSTRLDAAGLRKRAAGKGDVVIEVKPGESITSIAVGWALESYVKVAKAEEPKNKKEGKPKAAKAPAKKAAKPVAKAKGKPAKKAPAKAKPKKKK
ncbi:MAG TPA: hypothetical protein PLL95_07575, partial [Anaerolineales bacterium]|nr:hypothetical protein [Anaerolineales bacterium]